MITIVGTQITIPRGDTGRVTFISDEPISGRFVFGVKKQERWHMDGEPYIITKETVVDGQSFAFDLSSTETDISEGIYAWGLRRIGDEVDTFITRGRFVIERRVVHDKA